MITAWDIYWITRLDSLNGLMVGIICVSLLGIFMCLVIGDCAHDKLFYFKKNLLSLFLITFLCSVVGTFCPSTKEAVAIYMIPKIVNNEQVQKLPDNAMKFLNGKFEEWINDMTVKKKK